MKSARCTGSAGLEDPRVANRIAPAASLTPVGSGHGTRIKLVRFTAVGVVNTLLFAAATSFYVSGIGISSKVGTLLGYATILPFAFYASRSFTFSSDGPVVSELWRFVVTHAAGMLASYLAMATTVDVLRLNYAFGLALAAVFVPLVSFVVMNVWVFARRH